MTIGKLVSKVWNFAQNNYDFFIAVLHICTCIIHLALKAQGIFIQPLRYRASHHIFFIYLVKKDNGLNPKGLNKSMVKPKIQPKYKQCVCNLCYKTNSLTTILKEWPHSSPFCLQVLEIVLSRTTDQEQLG